MIKRNMTTLRKLMLLNGAIGGIFSEDTAIGNPLTFITNVAKPLKSLLIPFAPVQSGTGDPSPQNIRPIIGWDGVNVFHARKNLLSAEIEQGAYDVSNGTKTDSTTRVRTDGKIALAKGKYTISAVGVGQCRMLYYNGNSYVSASGYVNLPYTFTLDANMNINVMFRKSTNNEEITPSDISDVQIEVGETASAYEAPVTPSVYPVAFPSPVYGGTLDVVSGELWATYGEFVANGQNEPWGANEVGGKQRWSLPKSAIGDTKNNANVICNWLKKSTSQEWGGWIGSTGNFLCFTPLGEFADGDAWKEYLAENNLQIVFELAEPVLITTLTPQQINAIKGNNTIWSDADGSMTATYLKKG